jgi:hypothetical protein
MQPRARLIIPDLRGEARRPAIRRKCIPEPPG